LSAAPARPVAAPIDQQLLGFLLLSHLLYLAALIFNFLLLLLELTLGLLGLDFLVLHLVSDNIAATSTKSTADSRPRSRMADRGPDYRASTCAEQSTDTSTFFPFTKWLP
jgi:hypothetical protein